MATAPVLVSVEEYLSTVYRPDRDYVDGEVLERNMGGKPHSRLQGFFDRFFHSYEEEWNFETLIEQRLQINATRYRIPDVMLTSLPDSEERIVRKPPLLCVEVLSSEDRMKIRERLADYAILGVQNSWVIDPWRRTAYIAGADGVPLEVTDQLALPGTSVAITIDAIFSELDRLANRATARS